MRSLIPSIVAAFLGYLAARLIIPGVAPADPSPSNATTPFGPTAQTTQTSEPTIGPTVSAPRPTLKEVQAALNGRNTFVAAEKWQAWLDSATAEDLAQFVRDPKSLPQPHSMDFYQEFRDAFFDGLIQRWFAVDENALPSIRKFYEQFKKREDAYEASRIMRAATKARPEVFLTELSSRKDLISSEESSALRHLAARDLRKARELVSSLDGKARKSTEVPIILGIADTDPLSALALARALDPKDAASAYPGIITAAERIGPGILRQLFADDQGALDNYHGRSELLMRYPDLAAQLQGKETQQKLDYSPHPNYDLFRQADLMTAEERAQRIARCAEMPDGARETVAAALAASWAREEPLKATEWAMQMAKPEESTHAGNQAAHFAFLRWIHVDRGAAVAWLRSQPESPLRAAIGTNAASFLAEAGDLDAAIQLCRPNGTRADQTATAHFVQIYVERDPDAAAAWLATVPNAIDQETVSKLFTSWYPRDPLAVGRWVEALPEGKSRDQALNALVLKLSWDSPSAAAEWTETIADTALRQKAASFAFHALNRDDPARAQEWLQDLQGVDQEWKSRFARRLK